MISKPNDKMEIYTFIQELKSHRRRLQTNCYLSHEDLQRLIDAECLLIEYEEGAYINLIRQEDGFKRIYYYIADPEEYGVAPTNTCICDIFFRESKADTDNILSALKSQGFIEYARYSQFSTRKIRRVHADDSAHYFMTDITPEAIDLLYSTFDKYTDYLPAPDELNHYLTFREIISVYSKDNGYLGSLIFKQNENVFAEEFIYVHPDRKGQHIGRVLHNQLCDIALTCANEPKFTAWIKSDNLRSLAFHKRCGYEKDNLVKITLKRG